MNVTTKQRQALMGKIVTVNRAMKRQFAGKERSWEECEVSPRAGWVVGFRTLQSGIYKPGYNYEDPPYLQVTNTHSVVCVSFWYTFKPVYVPLSGFVTGGVPYYMTDSERVLLSGMSKEWDRDEKGRFKKV